MKKQLVGVIHLPPLPGSPRSSLDRDGIWSIARAEAQLMHDAGISAVIVENHGDAPFFPLQTPPYVSAFMAVLTDRLVNEFGFRAGVNILRNDGLGALSAATAAGAGFIRVNVLSGVAATDQGLVSGIAHDLMRTRSALHSDVEVWADLNVKFASQLYQPNLGDLAKSTHQRSLADALIVTGPATGQSASIEDMEIVKTALPTCPLYCGSGVTYESVGDILKVADGVIVGSDFKVDGYVENPIDPARLQRFVDAFEAASGN